MNVGESAIQYQYLELDGVAFFLFVYIYITPVPKIHAIASAL